MLLMNLMNERGHITINFPKYTMTHIHRYDYARELCKRFDALYSLWWTLNDSQWL